MPQAYAKTDESQRQLHMSGEKERTLKELKERFGNAGRIVPILTDRRSCSVRIHGLLKNNRGFRRGTCCQACGLFSNSLFLCLLSQERWVVSNEMLDIRMVDLGSATILVGRMEGRAGFALPSPPNPSIPGFDNRPGSRYDQNGLKSLWVVLDGRRASKMVSPSEMGVFLCLRFETIEFDPCGRIADQCVNKLLVAHESLESLVWLSIAAGGQWKQA